MLAWPSHLATRVSGTPLVTECILKLWRRPLGGTGAMDIGLSHDLFDPAVGGDAVDRFSCFVLPKVECCFGNVEKKCSRSLEAHLFLSFCGGLSEHSANKTNQRAKSAVFWI